MPSPSIQNTVANTFTGLQAKGLTETFTFTLVGDVEASDYDPTTGTFTDPTTTSTSVAGIVVTQNRVAASSPASSQKITLTILVDKADVGELDGYDTVTFNGDTYAIESYQDNLYAVEIVLTREVS